MRIIRKEARAGAPLAGSGECITMPRPAHHRNDMPRRLGAGMIALAWVCLLGLLTAYFSGWLEAERNPNRQVSAAIVEGGVREVILERNPSGHYVANGRINREPVSFLLDTGSTTVSVPAQLAARLGLTRGAPIRTQTANGAITTYATRLERVSLGNIVLHDIDAHINPRMQGPDVLLGMSFLQHLELFQRGGTLTLRQPAPES